MVFKAKNGSKWKHHWSWPFLHISIELLVPVAGRISANHRISELCRQAKARIFTENWVFFEDPKCFFIFAQWVWGPKLVLYKWVWSKISNSMMIWQYFLRFFLQNRTQCNSIPLLFDYLLISYC